MAFEFSLRGLLRLRKIYEQRERMRLVLLNASRARARDQHDEIRQRRLLDFQSLEERLQEGMPGSELGLESAFLERAAAHQREIAAFVEALDLQVRQQVDVYWESQKKRKILDSLRERERTAYQVVQDRREQQRIDDLFALRQFSGSTTEK
ncbi:MAG: flagellar export protein FliJ [Terriglobia bacterium]